MAPLSVVRVALLLPLAVARPLMLSFKHVQLKQTSAQAAPGAAPAVAPGASPAAAPVEAPADCPWLQGSSGATDEFLCADGSSCSAANMRAQGHHGYEGGLCCRGPSGGVAKCPPELPYLCATGVCGTRCETAGGPKICTAHGEEGLAPALAMAAHGGPLPLIDREYWFKAEMCAHQFPDSDAFEMCHEFMTSICDPGPDGMMNGSPGERTTGQGWCSEFFNRSPAPAPVPAGPAGPAMGNGHNNHDAHFADADRKQIFGDWTMDHVKDLHGIEMEVEDINQRLNMNVRQIRGSIEVVGPLPYNFPNIFAEAVADAVPGCKPSMVKIESMPQHEDEQAEALGDVRKLFFTAPEDVVNEVHRQVVDKDSHLVNGRFRRYLIARSKFHRYSEEEDEFAMSF